MNLRNALLTGILAMASHLALYAQNLPVTVEAESGGLGADFRTATQAGVTYTTIFQSATSINGTAPGTAARVGSYTVTFPAAGVYDLYARIRVGAAGANDDSFFYGNGFDAKPATDGAGQNNWITVNQLASAGFSASTDLVVGDGAAATNGVWKWLNMSTFSNGGENPISFTVAPGALTRTFQIGAREDGLDFDKFVFGLQGTSFTVANLDAGQAGTTVPPPPPFTPTGPPIATGKPKFLGSVYSTPQIPNFNAYWNQVIPENAGKWGSVEATRDVMNWTELDAAYKLAKDNNFPFQMHILIWGAQQPTWIQNLPPAEQLAEIEQWYAAVALRYPDIDIVQVVNEPTHDPPRRTGPTDQDSGNYIEALGGNGTTGWDWVIKSFELARQYFPGKKLMLNDYSVENTLASAQLYLTIINLLKDRNLVDVVGIQGHAFSTRGTLTTTLTSNLNLLASAGFPLYITELDIDGIDDQVQLAEYQRVFPIFWEHPAVKGITLWGYRPGHWRTAQGAFIALANGAERPALVWLKQYVQANAFKLYDPLYNCSTGNLTFRTSGGSTSPVEFQAIGVTSWTTNPTHTLEFGVRNDPNSRPLMLTARQDGNVVSYTYDFRASCANTNRVPVFNGPLAQQTGTVGQPFSYTLPLTAFTDPEDRPLTLTAVSLPVGLTLNATTRVISGTPQQVGTFTATITATDPQGNMTMGPISFAINNVSGGMQPLQLLEPLYNCSTGVLTFRTTGGTNALVEYFGIGVTNWSTQPVHSLEFGVRNDANSQPLALSARQAGTVVTYSFDFRAFCSRPARISADDEPTERLQVRTLGNPTANQLVVEVQGADGQELMLRLVDVRGRLIESRKISTASAVERQTFDVHALGRGLLLLQAQTSRQTQSIKVVKD